MINYKTYIFDFDGCIVDSVPAAVKAHMDSIKEVLGIELKESDVINSISNNYEGTIQNLRAINGDLDTSLNNEITSIKLKQLNDTLINNNNYQPFPIIPFLFEILRNQNTQIIVYSSSSKSRIVNFFENHNCFNFYQSEGRNRLIRFRRKIQQT